MRELEGVQIRFLVLCRDFINSSTLIFHLRSAPSRFFKASLHLGIGDLVQIEHPREQPILISKMNRSTHSYHRQAWTYPESPW